MTAEARTATWGWLVPFLAVSVAGHLAAFGSLVRRPATAAVHRPPALVTMEVQQRPPPPPAAPVAEPPRPSPQRQARRVAMARPVAPPAPVAPAAPATPPVADFTGVTLTNDGPGPGWSSAVGDGRASSGPIGPPPRAPEAVAPAPDPGPAVVPPADLQRAPEAPALDEALARNYPADERRQGVSGSAVIRARVLPDGQVRPLAVIAASRPAFAEACRRTLQGSRWSQPLDRAARPCATDIKYTCRFELD